MSADLSVFQYQSACNEIALYKRVGELCEVTKIFEGFGISLADNIGRTLIIKDIYQLPRIKVISIDVSVSGIFVVSDSLTNFVGISFEFFIVGNIGILINDSLCCCRNGIFYSIDFRSIKRCCGVTLIMQRNLHCDSERRSRSQSYA